jgi:hypothetical protein
VLNWGVFGGFRFWKPLIWRCGLLVGRVGGQEGFELFFDLVFGEFEGLEEGFVVHEDELEIGVLATGSDWVV